MPKQTIVTSTEGYVDSAVTFDIALKAFPANTLVCYDRLVAIDHTSAATNVQIGFKSGASLFFLGAGAVAALGGCVVVQGKVFAPGHFVPFARFLGATLKDRVALYVYGYTTDLPE